MASGDNRRPRDARSDYQRPQLQQTTSDPSNPPQRQAAAMQPAPPQTQFSQPQFSAYNYGFTQGMQPGMQQQSTSFDRNVPRSPPTQPYQQAVPNMMLGMSQNNPGYQYGMYAPVAGASQRHPAPTATSMTQQTYYAPSGPMGPPNTGMNISNQDSQLEQGQYFAQQSPLQSAFSPVSHPPSTSEYQPQFSPHFTPGSSASTPTSATSQRSAAFSAYHRCLRHTLESLQANRLTEAAMGLLAMSRELLGNVQQLGRNPAPHMKDLLLISPAGLVFDDVAQRDFRLQLWDNFNNAWLAVLTKQKEVSDMELAARTGENNTPLPARDRISTDLLQRLGDELVNWCNTVDEWGLVDYQMGVCEEQIIDLLDPCREISMKLDNAMANRTAPTTTRGQASGGAAPTAATASSITSGMSSPPPAPPGRRR